jgi:hypothetical protein
VLPGNVLVFEVLENSLKVLTQTQLQEQELQIYQNKRISELEQKIFKC